MTYNDYCCQLSLTAVGVIVTSAALLVGILACITSAQQHKELSLKLDMVLGACSS